MMAVAMSVMVIIMTKMMVTCDDKIMAMVMITGDIDGNHDCDTDDYKSHGICKFENDNAVGNNYVNNFGDNDNGHTNSVGENSSTGNPRFMVDFHS